MMSDWTFITASDVNRSRSTFFILSRIELLGSLVGLGLLILNGSPESGTENQILVR